MVYFILYHIKFKYSIGDYCSVLLRACSHGEGSVGRRVAHGQTAGRSPGRGRGPKSEKKWG